MGKNLPPVSHGRFGDIFQFSFQALKLWTKTRLKFSQIKLKGVVLQDFYDFIFHDFKP